MEQLTQKLKSGEMTVQAVPWPQVTPENVLVRNHFSLVSAGTESSTVKAARASLIGKARERPQQVRQVVDVLKKQGPVQTYRAVIKKMEAYSPLGYSSAGEVIAVGGAVRDVSVGDRVACAGAMYANHAEIVSVPRNLCVKLPEEAKLELACYNTLGAIALQGIRQADLHLGESCAVIGLGLLGQLTCLMLRASGVRTLGIDIDDFAVETAQRHCCDAAWNRTTAGLAERIAAETNGPGVDAVIITAASRSLDPINFAGQIARKKGRVVAVGAVPTGFAREPYWYKKELELRMSCSYGPGRYDLEYEEKGRDYPLAYVRWTENRNMQAFQELVHSSRIDIGYLTSHTFPLDDAPKAYDMIVNRSEPFLGVVLAYDVSTALEEQRVVVRPPRPGGTVKLAFIGAGSYAQSHLLPNLPKHDGDVVNKAVMTQTGTTSKRVAERFGFEFCCSRTEDIFHNDDINAVFIATRHDSHAQYVIEALKAGKHVFVEKPLCLTPEELGDIEQVYDGCRDRHLMVGFNRRFAPLAVELKSRIQQTPMSMMYRVNAGAIPEGAWAHDVELGGGRIIGEVCHFVDFLTWMCGSFPTEVHAAAMRDPHARHDTANISIVFADGSIGTICYYANGSTMLSKEYVEVYGSGLTGIITDFKELHLYAGSKPYRRKLLNQDKGQARMVAGFLQAVKEGAHPVIAPEEIFAASRVCFAALESIRNRRSIRLDDGDACVPRVGPGAGGREMCEVSATGRADPSRVARAHGIDSTRSVGSL